MKAQPTASAAALDEGSPDAETIVTSLRYLDARLFIERRRGEENLVRVRTRP